MTSKSKAVTESIPQSSLDESTEAKVQPSLASAEVTSKGTSTHSTPIMKVLSEIIRKGVGLDRVRQHSLFATVALKFLETNGLIRRFEVLSKEGKWMETQIVFDNTLWSRDLVLLLPDNTPTTPEGEAKNAIPNVPAR